MVFSIYSSVLAFMAFLGIVTYPKLPETPAGLQFGQWLDAFNTANRTTLLSYHELYFPYEAASKDVSSIDRELMLAGRTGGFELRGVESSSAYHLHIILQEINSPQFADVTIDVEESPPHRVKGFVISPIRTPDEFLSPDEREARRLDAIKRASVVYNLTSALKEHYISESSALKMSMEVEGKLENGSYNKIEDAFDLATALTTDLHSVGHDLHMAVIFVPAKGKQKPPSDEERFDRLKQMNFGFRDVQQLPNGVASLPIQGFVPIDIPEVRDAVSDRISAIANASALIIDLRENNGGDPQTVSHLISYLMGDEKVHLIDMYNPRTKTSQEFWTDPGVNGTKFGPSKPIYVLTSNETMSGGEEMAYDLQALGRATIIGEKTVGAANPGSVSPLGGRFIAIIPTVYPINAVTGTNWEGVGVTPNITVEAANALKEAYKKAIADLAHEIKDESGGEKSVPKKMHEWSKPSTRVPAATPFNSGREELK